MSTSVYVNYKYEPEPCYLDNYQKCRSLSISWSSGHQFQQKWIDIDTNLFSPRIQAQITKIEQLNIYKIMGALCGSIALLPGVMGSSVGFVIWTMTASPVALVTAAVACMAMVFFAALSIPLLYFSDRYISLHEKKVSELLQDPYDQTLLRHGSTQVLEYHIEQAVMSEDKESLSRYIELIESFESVPSSSKEALDQLKQRILTDDVLQELLARA